MTPLLSTLSSWKGRSFVQTNFERRGFNIHKLYQEEISKYCHNSKYNNDLEIYWDEIAKEWVMSAGRVASDRREFKGISPYRSTYLDNLKMELDETRFPFRFPSLHPCLNERRLADLASHEEMSRELGSRLHGHKEIELKNFSLDASDWTGTRGNLGVILGKLILNKGFYKVSTKNWNEDVLSKGYEYLLGDLIIQCAIKKGKYNDLSSSLDLLFRIFSRENFEYIYRDGDFNNVIPGLSYYSWFRSSDTAMLGVFALVEFIDIFVHSFG